MSTSKAKAKQSNLRQKNKTSQQKISNESLKKEHIKIKASINERHHKDKKQLKQKQKRTKERKRLMHQISQYMSCTQSYCDNKVALVIKKLGQSFGLKNKAKFTKCSKDQ